MPTPTLPVTAAELLARPPLRGRLPVRGRVREAREAWGGAAIGERLAAMDERRECLGAPLVRDVARVLEGADRTTAPVGGTRRRLLLATVAPAAVARAAR